MGFVEINFMEKMRGFLQSYPALLPGESLEVGYFQVSDNRFENPDTPQGYAVSFAGGNIKNRKADILGGVYLTEQVNLILVLRRYTTDTELRRNVGDFLFNYNRWINYEQEMRGTSEEHPLLPKISMTDHEMIRADGGMQTAVAVETGVDEFQLQIHLEFQTVYGPN